MFWHTCLVHDVLASVTSILKQSKYVFVNRYTTICKESCPNTFPYLESYKSLVGDLIEYTKEGVNIQLKIILSAFLNCFDKTYLFLAFTTSIPDRSIINI